MARAQKSRTHQVLVTLRFDKPVTNGAAVRAVKGNLQHVDMEAESWEADKDGWNVFKIRNVKGVPAVKP